MLSQKYLPRIITGIILLTLILTSIIFSGVYIFSVVLLFTIIAMWEFYTMFWPGENGIGGKIFALIVGALVVTAGWINSNAILPTICISFVLVTVYSLITNTHNTTLYFKQVGLLLFGIFYIPILLVPIFTFSSWEQLFVLSIVVASDTIAYFIGVNYGKHKIWPKISPKKSIEGSIAGLCASTIVAVGIGFFIGKETIPSFTVLGLTLGIVAQLGDFFESALKRATHLKDSGVILPGHGGILDRTDSLLFVIPTYALFKSFIEYF